MKFLLLKDEKTQKKSITVTCLLGTFLLTVASVLINLYLLLNHFPADTGMIWACIGFMSPFAAIYWRKRFRASSSGIEFGGSNDSSGT